MSQIYQSLMILLHPAVDPFDGHVLACTLDAASLQSGALGLAEAELSALLRHYFPLAVLPPQRPADGNAPEEEDLRHLLLTSATDPTNQTTRWLACMVAHRSQFARHLWQDLGLEGRQDLNRLLRRHFAPLAARNVRDMKWKKFFYRELCQQEGLAVCKSPVCDQCTDFDLCFGPEEPC